MFKDRSEELQRLEEALLEEEESELSQADEQDEDLLDEAMLDELLDDTAPGKTSVAYQNYSNDYGHEATDDPYAEDADVSAPARKKDGFGVVIAACFLLGGILCAILLWLIRGGLL